MCLLSRHLKERECLRRRLSRVLRQRDRVLLAGCTHQQMSELEETVDGIRANMDYINDSINECQAGIMAIEEAKVRTERFFVFHKDERPILSSLFSCLLGECER